MGDFLISWGLTLLSAGLSCAFISSVLAIGTVLSSVFFYAQ